MIDPTNPFCYSAIASSIIVPRGNFIFLGVAHRCPAQVYLPIFGIMLMSQVLLGLIDKLHQIRSKWNKINWLYLPPFQKVQIKFSRICGELIESSEFPKPSFGLTYKARRALKAFCLRCCSANQAVHRSQWEGWTRKQGERKDRKQQLNKWVREKLFPTMCSKDTQTCLYAHKLPAAWTHLKAAPASVRWKTWL